VRIFKVEISLKVIDLRESGRRMEEQLDEVEHETEVQGWKVMELKQLLQAERLENERRLVALQREHQEKVPTLSLSGPFMFAVGISVQVLFERYLLAFLPNNQLVIQ